MKIEEIAYGTIEVPLVRPFKTALRSVTVLESILVRITTASGLVGYGETAPTEAITGETKESILQGIAQIAKVLMGRDISEKESILLLLSQSIDRNLNAKSALEIALYDLFSQKAGKPLYHYLGGDRTVFETGITISLNDTATMVQDAQEAQSRGFGSLKIKLGDHYREDIARIEAISHALGQVLPLKLDANQGWSVEDSVAFLQAIETKGIPIELIEQPVAKENIGGLRWIKERTTIPLLADESVFFPEDARVLLESNAVDMINIKLDKCGGISKALEIADLCHAFGVECMIGCMMEGAVSVGAAAHVASARAETITMLDLDAPILCAESPVSGGVQFEGPHILLQESAGLGIQEIVGVHWIKQ